MSMRRSSALFGVVLAGCGAPQLLPTTLFHAPLARDAEPQAGDWARLTSRALAACDQVAASAAVGGGEWIVWATDAEHRGTLVLARRTAIGLEAQSFGSHVGPYVRPTIRGFVIGAMRVVVVESSSAASSTDRDASL